MFFWCFLFIIYSWFCYLLGAPLVDTCDGCAFDRCYDDGSGIFIGFLCLHFGFWFHPFYDSLKCWAYSHMAIQTHPFASLFAYYTIVSTHVLYMWMKLYDTNLFATPKLIWLIIIKPITVTIPSIMSMEMQTTASLCLFMIILEAQSSRQHSRPTKK